MEAEVSRRPFPGIVGRATRSCSQARPFPGPLYRGTGGKRSEHPFRETVRETVGNGGKGSGKSSPNSYRVTLVPLPGSPPAIVRLRRALKTLLRTYRLRCMVVEAIPGESPGLEGAS
jgi:hypothetical protein